MSKISFLDNAVQGKNTMGSYILTMGITFIGGIFASISLLILIVVLYFLSIGSARYDAQTNILNDPFMMLILIGISYGIFSLLFYLCVRFIHKKHFISLINTGKNIKWRRIIKGAGLWVGIMGFFTILSFIYQGGSLSFKFDFWPFIVLLFLSILIFPLQASFEEIFFRGYLMQAVGLITKKPVIPLIITTLIFGLIHFNNGTDFTMSISIVISALIIGLMLGIIVLGENGLETAMGVHIANNIYVALILNSSNSGLDGLPSLITAQSTDPLSSIPLLILMVGIMIIILFWNKKENLYRIFQ
ncbi:CPBP family intramembrane glutamic endopeptidase [Methanobacterium spitsbergense]|uniref:CPBP family intramembrane metalloprotease n=1 Tax=Methanobacterium spitsbergense TaxID=2874285 RepID=A0A8T5US71_9EURY|nr:type II CAAX endopeptidase family protein [Methanobacterium spitsbergense]MBZ2164816.1 CPBP family intramembrane metalloprotease [Methanobacterium spitsbergense]